MGRRVPDDNISLIHPILYLSFLAAGFAATIAIITALCGVRFRKKTSQPPPLSSDPLDTTNLNTTNPSSITVATTTEPKSEHAPNEESENRTETENNDAMKELPLPPAMQQPKDFPSDNLMKRVTSERRASFSVMSLKMPRSLSVAKNWDHMEDKIKGKLKTEQDSVWMKTIILGEKCVPDEEDPVIYEGKGKKVAAYHPKSYSTMSISRQTSLLDPDALPVPPQTREEKIK